MRGKGLGTPSVLQSCRACRRASATAWRLSDRETLRAPRKNASTTISAPTTASSSNTHQAKQGTITGFRPPWSSFGSLVHTAAPGVRRSGPRRDSSLPAEPSPAIISSSCLGRGAALVSLGTAALLHGSASIQSASALPDRAVARDLTSACAVPVRGRARPRRPGDRQPRASSSPGTHTTLDPHFATGSQNWNRRVVP
jgi:hypothetical protein